MNMIRFGLGSKNAFVYFAGFIDEKVLNCSLIHVDHRWETDRSLVFVQAHVPDLEDAGVNLL